MNGFVVYTVFILLIAYIARLLLRTPFQKTDRTEPLLAYRVLGTGIGLNPRHPIGWLFYLVILIVLVLLLISTLIS